MLIGYKLKGMGVYCSFEIDVKPVLSLTLESDIYQHYYMSVLQCNPAERGKTPMIWILDTKWNIYH